MPKLLTLSYNNQTILMFTGHLLTNGTIEETTIKTPGLNHVKSGFLTVTSLRRQFVILCEN